MKKKCSCCRQEKSLCDFHRSKSRPDGHHVYCKSCRKDKANKSEVLKEYRQKWYSTNREVVIERSKSRNAKKKAEVKRYKKKHYQENKEYYKTKANKRYASVKNDSDFIENRKKYMAGWRKRNKYVVVWRSILRTCLRRMKQNKSCSTFDSLGYSAEAFREHIESMWQPGMSWENHGAWHIDHIKPVKNFEPKTDPRVVNALDNLRPLWATTRTINGITYEGNLNREKK